MNLFCPNCGAPIEFRYDGSFVRVCGSCRVAIRRTDRGVDTLGQFADLAPSESGLTLLSRGHFQGFVFELAGRALYAHPAGGSWEEWFLRFSDGRWGWLSHAHGTWAITFRAPMPAGLPAFEQVVPGLRLDLGQAAPFVVGECNTASFAAAQGELPFSFPPGALGRFVDLSDQYGSFATLDYGPPGSQEPPLLFLGRATQLSELGLRASEAPLPPVPTRTGEALACPNCGGGISLMVPDRSLCVACPYCGSVLDCEGPLAILERHAKVEQQGPGIPLGSKGIFAGEQYTIVGRLQRRAFFEGGHFDWDEYLLYAAKPGYRWLVCANGHYSFVTPLAPGAVDATRPRPRYRGREFALFDRGVAVVQAVYGEFYWKVRAGDRVETADFIAPPVMLSSESDVNELNWSFGVYLTPAEVRRALGLERLPSAAIGVAPHQPFRWQRWTRVAGLLLAALFLCIIIRGVLADGKPIYSDSFGAQPSDAAVREKTRVFFTPPFQLRGRRNVAVTIAMPLDNDWAYAAVDLVHEATGEIRSYARELEYYWGVAEGERWAEGSREDTHIFSGALGGSYVLRLEVETGLGAAVPVSVEVKENVFPNDQLGLVLLLLAAPSALLLFSQFLFERSRWSNSDFAPAHYRSE